MARKAGGLEIGLATVDITPPVGVTLSGYKPRISQAVAHKLRTEALVCRGPRGRAWALVTSDIIGYPGRYVKLLRQKISRATGLTQRAIMISATHTHSGPTMLAFGEEASAADRAYHKELLKRLVALVKAARRDLRPGWFETAWAQAPALGSNRRVQLADGTWGNEWEDHEGRHPGYFDPTVLLVGVRRPDASLAALLVNFGMHPVTLGPKSLDISPDYVGYMKDALESRGQVGVAMFALAGAGNINPRVCIQVGAEHPRAAGERLADIVVEALSKLAPVPAGTVAAHVEPWRLKRTREAFRHKDRPGRRVGDIIKSEFQVLRAGELGLVGLPGELFSEFSRKLRHMSPFGQTAVVSLANDYVGYLPTDAAQGEGAYEVKCAPCAGLEGMIIERAGRAFAAFGGRGRARGARKRRSR
jgi:hypothetical protein